VKLKIIEINSLLVFLFIFLLLFLILAFIFSFIFSHLIPFLSILFLLTRCSIIALFMAICKQNRHLRDFPAFFYLLRGTISADILKEVTLRTHPNQSLRLYHAPNLYPRQVYLAGVPDARLFLALCQQPWPRHALPQG
jgi:hypothetical protein